MEKINIAIFASGKASNAKVLLEESEKLTNIQVKSLVTDNPNSGVFNLGSYYKIPVILAEKTYFPRSEHERLILEKLAPYNIQWIFLAGYMRILSQSFIDQFTVKGKTQIVNIHPSLLPKYKGMEAMERTFQENDEYGGISIHFVTSGVDEGPIIAQESFPRFPMDSFKEFKKRGQRLEHKLYPMVLKNLNQHLTIKEDLCVSI